MNKSSNKKLMQEAADVLEDIEKGYQPEISNKIKDNIMINGTDHDNLVLSGYLKLFGK